MLIPVVKMLVPVVLMVSAIFRRGADVVCDLGNVWILFVLGGRVNWI